MRLLISTVLIALLVADQLPAQQAATGNSVKQEISALPSTALIEVRMQGGDRVRGHIVSRGESDFALEREKGGGTQTIAYDQVLSISQVKAGHSHKKWIIIGVVIAGVAIVAIVIGVKASHPLSGTHF